MRFRILLIALLTGTILHAQGSLTAIAHPTGSPAQLTSSELKSVFMGETKKWSNGSKVMIALMKTFTDAGKLTCDRVYRMSGDEVQKFWLGYVIAGKGEAPAFFNSVNELMAFVAANPGSIGIIDQTAPSAGTKVVLIDGKRSF